MCLSQIDDTGFCEDTLYCRDTPFFLTAGREVAICHKLIANSSITFSLKEEMVDFFDRHGLFLVDDQIVVWPFVVTEETREWDRDLAISETLTLSPGAIL